MLVEVVVWISCELRFVCSLAKLGAVPRPVEIPAIATRTLQVRYRWIDMCFSQFTYLPL